MGGDDQSGSPSRKERVSLLKSAHPHFKHLVRNQDCVGNSVGIMDNFKEQRNKHIILFWVILHKLKICLHYMTTNC